MTTTSKEWHLKIKISIIALSFPAMQYVTANYGRSFHVSAIGLHSASTLKGLSLLGSLSLFRVPAKVAGLGWEVWEQSNERKSRTRLWSICNGRVHQPPSPPLVNKIRKSSKRYT